MIDFAAVTMMPRLSDAAVRLRYATPPPAASFFF